MATILIVEDNQQMQVILKSVFETFGYKKVIQAFNIGQAEELLGVHLHELNVILMDRNLKSGVTTDSLVKQIKKHNPSIPVVAFSGNPNERKEQLAIGCSHELEKPIEDYARFEKMFTSFIQRK